MSKQREALDYAMGCFVHVHEFSKYAIENIREMSVEPVDPVIAAAPDLLEALETLVRNGTRSTLEDWEAAMVAIAKARGEV